MTYVVTGVFLRRNTVVSGCISGNQSKLFFSIKMNQSILKPTRSAPRLKQVEAPTQNASEKVIFGEPAVLYPVGIRTFQGKYLTVESFGDQLNANGPALRTKQVFVIETDGSGKFAFKTHKGKYLTADHKEVAANASSTGEKEWFYLIYNDGVAYFYTSDGKYLCVDDSGNVKLTASPDAANAEFEIQINYHPQVCLITQKRYIAALPNGEVVSNRDNQFGKDTMITMEEGAQRGTYALRSSNQKYFNVDGDKVTANQTQVTTTNALFCFEFHGNNLAIKNVGTGKYLTVHGTGLKVQRTSVTTKDIFILVDSDAQITIKAGNGKYVGFQGANLMTTKTSVSNDEILMLESDKDKWAFRTHQDIYWSIKPDGTIAVDGKSRGPSELFTLEYQGAKTLIRGSNGKYISAKPLGGLEAKSSEINPNCLFEFYFLNRPQLVLMTNQQSFVGTQDGKVRTNKVIGEPFTVDFSEGRYALRNDQGYYLAEGPDAKIGLAEKPEWFFFEYKLGSLSIKTEKGKYLKSENQGWLVATADKAEATELYTF